MRQFNRRLKSYLWVISLAVLAWTKPSLFATSDSPTVFQEPMIAQLNASVTVAPEKALTPAPSSGGINAIYNLMGEGTTSSHLLPLQTKYYKEYKNENILPYSASYYNSGGGGYYGGSSYYGHGWGGHHWHHGMNGHHGWHGHHGADHHHHHPHHHHHHHHHHGGHHK